MNSTIWIITALLWFEGINEPRHTEYNLAQFTAREQCLDHVFWNQADLVEQLYDVHSVDENDNKIRTWSFYCENRILPEV